MTAARVEPGKSCPLAAAWVATRMSISPTVMAAIIDRALFGSLVVSEEKTSSRASGNSRRASSATRSTPGPTDTREWAAPQRGQSVGFGIEKPVR